MTSLIEGPNISREIANGEGVYLAVAAKLLPKSASGKPVSPSTLFRWATKGVVLPNKSVLRLEAVQLAGRLLTTHGALMRFIERQSVRLAQDPTPFVRSPSKRAKAAEAATERLKADYGI